MEPKHIAVSSSRRIPSAPQLPCTQGMTTYSDTNLDEKEKELGFSSTDSLAEEALIQQMENLGLKSIGISNGDGITDISGLGRGRLLPLRPYAVDCHHYLRTGTCKFGLQCRYNHPARKAQQLFKENESGSYNVGTNECKYFSATGVCKYGNSCRYFHPGEEYEHTVPKMNFLGLPLRPGVKECPYYMRTGSCQYGSQCIHHHPDPTSAGQGSPISVDESPGKPFSLSDNCTDSSLHLLGTSNHDKAPWSSREFLENIAHYSIPLLPERLGEQSEPKAPWSSRKFFENIAPYSKTHLLPELLGEQSEPKAPWSSHKLFENIAPYSKTHLLHELLREQSESNAPWSSHLLLELLGEQSEPNAYQISSHQSCDSHSNPYAKGPMQVENFPKRPDQPVCCYYMKTGDCKFKSTCKFDHPENRTLKPEECGLNEIGLPSRPRRGTCWHFARFSHCKFGQACHFDHPRTRLP